MSRRVDLLIAATQDALEDLRTYQPRDRRDRIKVGLVHALCAVAHAVDRLADALEKETP